MIIFRTTFQIKPEHRAEFLEAMVDIASGAIDKMGMAAVFRSLSL